MSCSYDMQKRLNNIKTMKFKLLLIAFILHSTVFGQTITLTLNNVPETIICNEIWTEQNLDMRLVETTSDDCTSGSCYFGFWEQSLALWPSRLTIDLSSLQNIQMVEIEGPNKGDNYVGEFKDDMANGQGTYTWASGDIFVGEWKDNKMYGQGTYTFANGDILDGYWKKNKFKGKK